MAITSAQEALLEGVFGTLGDSPKRRALMAQIADTFGFARSGDNLTGKLVIPGSLSATGVGTAANDTTIATVEYYNGIDHLTQLTLTAFAVGTGDDNANLAIGAQVYTFGSGAIAAFDGTVSGIFDQTSHGVITAGEVALGTVVGSGANATLSSTMENIFDGGVSGVISTYTLGTTVVNVGGIPASTGALKIATGGTKSVFLNIAAAWPNIAAAEAVTFTGVITLRWRKIS